MNDLIQHKQELTENGFTTIDNIYSTGEMNQLLAIIANIETTKDTFRKSVDLFAIRQFLKEVPEAVPLIFNDNLRSLVEQIIGANYFVVKSIYFDKPKTSNWYVSYHQDLTISVSKKIDIDGFGPWTKKQDQFAVQPTIGILENSTTVRIHLDDADENNGALRVVPKSHLWKICRPEMINFKQQAETICKVRQGGVMFMKPLLLHSSGRTTNGKKRRVLHIEFSNQELPGELQWAERMDLNCVIG